MPSASSLTPAPTPSAECPICGNPRPLDDGYGPGPTSHQLCDEAEADQ